MSLASPSSASDAPAPRHGPLPLWPQSLLGRLIATSIVAVLLAQAVALALIIQERQRFFLTLTVNAWMQSITETTQLLQPLSATERSRVLARLGSHRGADGGSGAFGPSPGPWRRPSQGAPAGVREPYPRTYFPLPAVPGLEETLRRELLGRLGPGFAVEVYPTPRPEPPAITVPASFVQPRNLAAARAHPQRLDVRVRLPDGDTVTYRVTRPPGGAPLPRNLFFNLMVMMLVLIAALYLLARTITRPLSELAHAADRVGRDAQPATLRERGARELRDAARAFNTMQDRLRRYLDSRTRVLAAMSHDLKTPLTRLRLQVETLVDPAVQGRIGRQLDEMESLVHESLALFRGLDDGETASAVDVGALLEQVRGEFADMGATVTVSGQALGPLTAKAQVLKRCLTNLTANAVKFGHRAEWIVADCPERLVLRVRDEGPGIPEGELERVFEPFYRLEASRNRDSGGTGLGLSIARDAAQMHGGTLSVHNRTGGGLEAVLSLPRR